MTLYEKYKTALAQLDEMNNDMSPDGDLKFAAWQRFCKQLKDEIYYLENRS
jgi:hypothetical protein